MQALVFNQSHDRIPQSADQQEHVTWAIGTAVAMGGEGTDTAGACMQQALTGQISVTALSDQECTPGCGLMQAQFPDRLQTSHSTTSLAMEKRNPSLSSGIIMAGCHACRQMCPVSHRRW